VGLCGIGEGAAGTAVLVCEERLGLLWQIVRRTRQECRAFLAGDLESACHAAMTPCQDNLRAQGVPFALIKRRRVALVCLQEGP